METSSAALAQFERELNVINPEEKTNIVSARLLQLNEEYTTAQADRVRKEAAYTSIRSGSMAGGAGIDAGRGAEEADRQPERSAAEIRRSEDALRRESSGVQEGADGGGRSRAPVAEHQGQHRAARGDRIPRRDGPRADAAESGGWRPRPSSTSLNARSFEYQSIKREAEGDKKLYEDLVRKIKEAGINAGFQNSSIRVADAARPGLKPVFPNIELNVALAFLFSSLLAFGAALVSDAMDTTIRDPEQVMRTLQTQVVGSLPQVKTWRGQLATVSRTAAATASWSRRATPDTAASAPTRKRSARCAIRSCSPISIASSARCWSRARRRRKASRRSRFTWRWRTRSSTGGRW